MPGSSIRQRLTAGIAILAVLLLFIAPVISTHLAEHHATLQRAAAVSAEMPGMDQHSGMTMADHGMMEPGFACGYCDLLVHVPLMLWVFVPFIWWMCLISRAPPPSVINPAHWRRVLRLYRPRAPPALRHTHC